MSKSSFRQKAFSERRANFSTRIMANGRMDILPKEAIVVELERKTMEGTIASLYEEKSRLTKALKKSIPGTKEHQNIRDSLCRCTGNLGSIQEQISRLKSMQYGEVFTFAAQQLLTEEALSAIRECVWELWGMAKRQ